ncbi:YggT family protein [Hydrogenophaga sp. 5NK40-0174]|uniref:YggT family protein n=1 Tax=Hydrogenophaga sp. 5NK40-0174 TaxID=3127649 RepID=UPI003102B81F
MNIVHFLLETFFFILVGAALMRSWMNYLRIQMSVQPGRFVMAVTDWVVKPVRKVLPKPLLDSRLDWGSLMSAILLSIAFSGIVLSLWAPSTMVSPVAWLLAILLQAGKFLLMVVLRGLMIILLIYAVLSWVQPQAPAMGVLHRFSEPLLRPIRKVVPAIGGVDLSVLILVILLQVIMMALNL